MPKQHRRKKALKSLPSVTTLPSQGSGQVDAEQCLLPLLLMLGLGAKGLGGLSGLGKGLGGLFGGGGLGGLFGGMGAGPFGGMNWMGSTPMNGMNNKGGSGGFPNMNNMPGMNMNAIPWFGNMGNGFPFMNPGNSPMNGQGMPPNFMQSPPQGNNMGTPPRFPFPF